MLVSALFFLRYIYVAALQRLGVSVRYKVLTHITLLGEPIEDPGGEIEASERRLCCVTKHTKK